MDKMNNVNNKSTAEADKEKLQYAAELFSRLSLESQKAIIDLIKSLLSER